MVSKKRAFLIHCAASMAVVALFCALVFGVWYPSPLFSALGVTTIVLLLIGVDAVLGPLLTLLVYRPGKRTLRFDMSVIIMVQVGAFLYGAYSVAQGRPAWIVFNIDRFDVVTVAAIDQRGVAAARADYRSAPLLGPGWVAAFPPSQIESRNSILFEAVFAGLDLPQRPEYYRPLSDAAEIIRKYARPLAELKQHNPSAKVEKTLADWPKADAYLPLMGRVKAQAVLIERASAEVLGIVDLNPWE